MRTLGTPSAAAHWLREHVTGTLCTDSRVLQAGDGFLAWPGAATDARSHIAAVLAAGASVCLAERQGAEAFGFSDPRIALYDGLKADGGQIAGEYFQDPSSQLAVLAVTGTNGKTSTAWWLAQALSHLRSQPLACGVIGTLGIGVPPALVSTGLTTPDPVCLQSALAQFVADGFEACAIEASSIGIEEHRLDGTRIHTAVLTNVTQDHLDYHGSMDAYWQAKTRLFACALRCSTSTMPAVLNWPPVWPAPMRRRRSISGLFRCRPDHRPACRRKPSTTAMTASVSWCVKPASNTRWRPG